ncbi:LysR substrate-binding domain-containing protein [Caballeronia sp.]|uniref:LysR substrate-binding domain-containing protein n=1 Tax=Caballeronia sp. TaxID=1931223 RepID=UPI003C49AA2F
MALHIAEYGTNQLESALSDRHVEIAAAMLPVEGRAFLTQTFVRDRLALLCCREHALATRKKVGLGELAQESFVACADDFKVNDLVDRVCRTLGFVPSVAGRSSHLDLIVSMVASGIDRPGSSRIRGRSPAHARTCQSVVRRLAIFLVGRNLP